MRNWLRRICVQPHFLILSFSPFLILPVHAQKKEISQARDILKKGKNVEQAEKLMTGLLKDTVNLSNKRIYDLWLQAVGKQYEQANERLYLKQKQDTAAFFDLTRRMFTIAETLDSLEMVKRFSWDYHRPLLWGNGTFNPILNYTVKGILYYQGCSNVGDPGNQYSERLALLASQWREQFGLGEIPFYFVQIAPYYYDDDVNGVSGALLREQQQRAASLIPNSADSSLPKTAGGRASGFYRPEQELRHAHHHVRESLVQGTHHQQRHLLCAPSERLRRHQPLRRHPRF